MVKPTGKHEVERDDVSVGIRGPAVEATISGGSAEIHTFVVGEL